MGNVTSYAVRVREVLSHVAEHLKKIPKPGVETLLVEDPTQAVFSLNRVGWHAGSRVNNTVILTRIKDSKVWIEEDNTDLPFSDELLRAGIPQEDVVFGFQPPEVRRLTDVAFA